MITQLPHSQKNINLKSTLDFGKFRNAWQTLLSKSWTSTNTILSSKRFNSFKSELIRFKASWYILLSRYLIKNFFFKINNNLKKTLSNVSYKATKRVSKDCFRKMRFSCMLQSIVSLQISIWSGNESGISENRSINVFTEI